MPEDSAQEPSPYDVLGVRTDASTRDILRAYRRLARAWHPDVRPAGAGATARFQAASDAYELLSDPARRAGYDERRRASAAARIRPSAPESAARGPAASSAPPFLSSPPVPLWPLGPATTDPVPSRQRGVPAGPAVWPGPARLEPLTGDRHVGRLSAEARLLLLAEFVRACPGDDRHRPW